jgi:HK97 family phage prohead protease
VAFSIERKIIGIDACEVKLAGGGDEPVTVEGYGSVFNTNPDSYGDVIAPGAYGKTVAAIQKRGWLTMKYDHFQGIGKWTEVKEDKKGLYLKGELTPGHSGAADVAALLKHGAIAGLSIGFRTIKSIRDAKGIRTLQEIDLSEVSIVHDPAQRQAGITAVKADEISSVREFEAFLRDAGYSRREAEDITEKGFKAWLRARDEPSAGDGTDERRDDGKAVGELLASLRGLRVA